jgi:hypothetical protein
VAKTYLDFGVSVHQHQISTFSNCAHLARKTTDTDGRITAIFGIGFEKSDGWSELGNAVSTE